MTILRILPLLLLAAACIPHREERWAPVPANAGPIACTAVRLAARGWTVDSAYTDSIHIRVARREHPYEFIVTGELLAPPNSSYVRVSSEWWRIDRDPRDRIGMVLDHAVEMRNAMKSCGIDAYGRRPIPTRPRS